MGRRSAGYACTCRSITSIHLTTVTVVHIYANFVPYKRLSVDFFEGSHPVVYVITIYYSMSSLHNTYNSCIITTGYIRLHVSAVTRPSSGQQGIVLIKVHSLAFSNGIPLFTLKILKLIRPVFMVKMLLDLKYKIYNFF